MKNSNNKRKINFFWERLDVVIRHHSGEEFFLFKSSAVKTLLFFILIAILTLAISLTIFVYTPIIRWLNIVGDNKIISTEKIFDNIVSIDKNMSRDELIFRYFAGKREDVDIDYNRIISAIIQVDSLNKEVELWKLYVNNINQILAGTKNPIKSDSIISTIRQEKDLPTAKAEIDSILRNDIYSKLEILENENAAINRHKIYPPINGQITTHFDYKQKINGVTFSSGTITPIMSVIEGTVLLSAWNPNDGYVVIIQHPDNFISIYKGIAQTMKEPGERVSAREVIGYIGGNGADMIADTLMNVMNPNDSHKLYFELWHNGTIVDPERYIIF